MGILMGLHPLGARRHGPRLKGPLAPVVYHPQFKLAIACLLLSALVIPVEAAFGGVHAHTSRDRLISIVTIIAFVILGAVGVRRMAVESGRAVRSRGDRSAGTTIEIIISVIGCLLILLATMDLFGISTKNLLLGGAAIGLVLAAALQQTLANIFAGVVLLLTHPFTVGDHVRIRGSFGGELTGTVLATSLLHVMLDTEQGVLRLPNTGVSAAAIGPLPPPEPTGPQIG
jgi:small-conductance mechanosensitive channel